jgi:DNA polymerase I-like protein with 3'-5' exonuclease and polymerase domains
MITENISLTETSEIFGLDVPEAPRERLDFGFERVIVRTADDLRVSIAELMEAPDWIGTDTETTGLDPREGAVIRLVQLGSKRLKKTFIIDMFDVQDHTPFIPLFESNKHIKIFMNAQFDIKMMLATWGVFPEYIFDIMLADQLLTPFYKKKAEFGAVEEDVDPDFVYHKQVHGLDDIALRRLGIFLDKTEQKDGWDVPELAPEKLEYAALDAEILIPLFENLVSEIMREGMQDAMKTENRLVLVCAQMSLYGFKVDRNELGELDKEILAKVAQAEITLAEYLPNPQETFFGVEPINLNSRGELLHAMNRELNKARDLALATRPNEEDWPPSQWKMIENPIKVNSVKGQVLKEYRFLCTELIQAYSDWKGLTKMYSSNLLNIIKEIDETTDRVYPHVFQLGQPTTRIQFVKPNMLNIPRPTSYGPQVPNENSPRYSDRSFRSIFVTEPGWKLCIADYDSAQLRIIINHSGDEGLIRAMQNGEDLHSQAAELAFKRPITKKDKIERNCGKTLNFGCLFGAGGQRTKDSLLAMYDVDMSLEECTEMVKNYKAAKPAVVQYHKRQVDTVKKQKRIRVKGGRSIIIHPQAELYSESLNFPQVLVEQSGIRLAMVEISRELLAKQMRARIIFYCYDELAVEAPDDEAEAVCEMMERQMKRCMDIYMGPHLYSDAEAKAVDSWAAK